METNYVFTKIFQGSGGNSGTGQNKKLRRFLKQKPVGAGAVFKMFQNRPIKNS
jgi:hypothetical protein